jgi:hypothetical protein
MTRAAERSANPRRCHRQEVTEEYPEQLGRDAGTGRRGRVRHDELAPLLYLPDLTGYLKPATSPICMKVNITRPYDSDWN